MSKASQYFWMGLLTFQFALQPFFIHLFLPSSLPRTLVVLMINLTKMCVCGLLLGVGGSLGQVLKGYKWREGVTYSLPPAILYCFQNYFIQYG